MKFEPSGFLAVAVSAGAIVFAILLLVSIVVLFSYKLDKADRL
ncbi:MAG TPA: hypothetical protein VN325_11405 [Steroidobacteraceae bacterium]|jgi:hypothetical protein|nr:hypothetical protein [Steroidobacteraceae bacterium]